MARSILLFRRRRPDTSVDRRGLATEGTGGGGHAGSKRESCIRVHPLDREESAPETRKVISRV